MTVRYGIIGAGMMGQEHIRNIRLFDGVEITAIVEPDDSMQSAAVAECARLPAVFSTHQELVAADLCDAFVIATPNDTHHAVLRDLLPVNKPILCEKPMCTTVADCRDVIAQSSASAAPVWVAMEYRYMPPLQKLREKLAAGIVGVPQMLAIREHRFPFLPKVDDWNRFNRRTGGTLTEKCCHFWDLMRLLLGSDPVRVYASAGADVNHRDEQYGGETPDIIDNAFVIVEFANGSRGMLDLCMFAEGSYWQEVVSVTGPAARIDACVPGPARFSADGAPRNSQIVVSHRESRQVVTEELQVEDFILHAGDHHGSTFYQHERFLHMLRSQSGVPEVTLEDGLWSVIVGEAAGRAARTGQTVELERP